MPGLRPKPFRKFNRVILGIAAGILVVFTAFNTWINPLWVTPTPWTDEKFAEYRPIYRQQRTGKAGIARSAPWKVAFFGSSRADIAFDPMLPQWGKPAVTIRTEFFKPEKGRDLHPQWEREGPRLNRALTHAERHRCVGRIGGRFALGTGRIAEPEYQRHCHCYNSKH